MNLENPRSPDDSVIDLAHEADFRLGSLMVSPSSREVTRGGEREALEPRVMQVLVALYRAQGSVVSRDDLITCCWEGRIVGEDAINRAIWRLRKLAEADGDANFTIETIPRVGYRLMGGLAPAAPERGSAAVIPAVEARETTGQPGPAISSLPRRPRWRLIAGLALLAAGASAIAAWLLWPERLWTVESSRPFVSTLALEGEPAFSPNGAMLAYTSGADILSRKIYVRNVAGGDGIKVTNDAYDDVSPSWSSDGTRIAYIAQKSGDPCRIMIATVPAGEAREVGRCRVGELSSLTWQPNTPFLYYIDQDDGLKGDAIVRIDLNTGARLDIVKARNLRDPRVSPDGKSLSYRTRITEVNVASHIMVRDLTSGKEKILGRVRATGSAAWGPSDTWSADSKTVLASSSNGSDSQVIAFPVDGHAPYRIYASATGISHLSASAGGLLAIESHTSRKNLARASSAPIAQPDIIDPANGITYSPTFAPDGTLAFVSDRSGTNAVWIKKPGASPVPLFDAGSASLGRQNFSPDGTRLVVALGTPDRNTVKVLTVDGASVASFDLPTVGWGLPTWTPDGKGLIVYDRSIHRAVRVDVADPSRRTPVAPPDWQGVTIRSNGTFATRDDKPGLWRIDHGTKLISDKYPAVWGPVIAFLGEDVLIPDFSAAGGARILGQPISGGPDRVFAYAPGAEGASYQSKMTVNPKTGEIIYVATVQSDTNIDLLTLAKH